MTKFVLAIGLGITPFDISMEQLREMPGDALIKWEKEINKVLWGGFNGETMQRRASDEKKTLFIPCHKA